MTSSVPLKLRQGLPAFMNPDDPVVGTVQGAHAQVFEAIESALEDAHTIVGILGAAGTDLDDIAGFIYGVPRIANETDAHYLTRLSALLDSGAVSPQGIVNYLSSVNQTVTVYEPAGGSLVGWDPRKNFRYDRSTVTPTFSRNSTATYGGTTYAANDPVFIKQNNEYYWVGVFPANGATSATDPDVFTIPAQDAIGTQSQGTIVIGIQTGAYGPTSGGYLLDYGGTFSIWYDGTNVNWTIGGSTLQSAWSFTSGDAAIIAATWGSGQAQLYVNGTEVASGTVPNPPTTVSGDVYIGCDHTGANQIGAFLGNFAFLEAWWPASRIQAVQALSAVPVFAQTLYSGAFFAESLGGIQGGMIDGVSNYVGVDLAQTVVGLVIDRDYMDNAYMTNAQQAQLQDAATNVFPLFAGGKKTFLYTNGQRT